MCTLVILRRPGHRWPVLIGANRDEMIDRPSRPPGRHWPDRPEVVAGRDELEEGWSEAGELVALEDRIARERRYSVMHEGRRLLPDHILASSALARNCVAARIFNEDLVDESRAKGPVVGSFHAPLTADFGFADQGRRGDLPA